MSVDTFDLLGDRLPVALTIVALGSFILLFLLTGSVLLPIKAILLSALGLAATFGALVYIFQEGNLQWLVGDFVVTGAITWLVPIIVIAIAFALSLDYAVFILSRITEEYRRTGRNEEAVAVGLERTGRVVSYAAICLALVFGALAPSNISYLKACGIGLPLAVLLDATLVRGVLVPAFMKLLGRANWWAPGPLRRFHARYGIQERTTRSRCPARRRSPSGRPPRSVRGLMTETVVIAGQGYVGLPLAMRPPRSGHDVVGYDVDSRPDQAARRRRVVRRGHPRRAAGRGAGRAGATGHRRTRATATASTSR